MAASLKEVDDQMSVDSSHAGVNDGDRFQDEEDEDDRKPAARHSDDDNDSDDGEEEEDIGDDSQSSSDDDNDEVDGDSDGDMPSDNDDDDDDENKKDDGLSEYERLREERIRRNKEYLAQLGLDDMAQKAKDAKKQQQANRNSRRSKPAPAIPMRESLGRSSKERKATYSDSMSLKELMGPGRGKLPSKKKGMQHGKKGRPRKSGPTLLDKRLPLPVYRELQRIGKNRKTLLKQVNRQVKASAKHVFWFEKRLAKYQKQLKRKKGKTNRKLRMEEDRTFLNGKTRQECWKELQKRKTQLWQVVVDYERKEKEATKSQAQQARQAQLEERQRQFQTKMEYLDTWDVLPQAYKETALSLSHDLYQRVPKDPAPPRRSSRGGEEPRSMYYNSLPMTPSSMLASKMPNWRRNIQLAYQSTILSQDSAVQPEEHPLVKKAARRTPPPSTMSWISPVLEQHLDRDWLCKEQGDDPMPYQVGSLVLYYPGAHASFLKVHPDHVGHSNSDIPESIKRSRKPLWEQAMDAQSRRLAARSSNQDFVSSSAAEGVSTTVAEERGSRISSEQPTQTETPARTIPLTEVTKTSSRDANNDTATRCDRAAEDPIESATNIRQSQRQRERTARGKRGHSASARITQKDADPDLIRRTPKLQQKKNENQAVQRSRSVKQSMSEASDTSHPLQRQVTKTRPEKRGRSADARLTTQSGESNGSTDNGRAARTSRFQGTFKVPTESVRDLFHGAAVSAKIGTKKERMLKLAQMKKRAKVAPRGNKLSSKVKGRSKVSIRKIKKLVIKVGSKRIELAVPKGPKKQHALKRRRVESDAVDSSPDGESEIGDLPLPSVPLEDEPEETDLEEGAALEAEPWWSKDWLNGIDSDLGRYPILCRIEQSHAEFPQDPHKKKVDKHGNVTWIISQTTASRMPKEPIRLCLKLKPLTPVMPPVAKGDSHTLPLPPKFSVVTFPSSEAQSFLIPFAEAFTKYHSLEVGDTVAGLMNGKVAHIASLGESFGSFQLADKVKEIRGLLQQLEKGDTSSVAKCLGIDSASLLYEEDVSFLVEALHMFMENESLDDQGGIENLATLSLLDILRSCFPLFNGIGVRREAFHRKVSYLSAWDVDHKKKPNASFGENLRDLCHRHLARGVQSYLPMPLRVRIRYLILDFLESRPEAAGFSKAIAVEDAPSYNCAVPVAMYFDRILARLNSGKNCENIYYTSVESILSDIQAVMINCRVYNSRDSPLVTVCSSLVPALKKSVALAFVNAVRDRARKARTQDTQNDSDSNALQAISAKSIARCFDILKRRALTGKKIDHGDDRYRLDAIMGGSIPSVHPTGSRSLPTFEDILLPRIDVGSTGVGTRGARRTDDDEAISTLSECLFLPPWAVDTMIDNPKQQTWADSPKLCLELVRLRLKEQYYSDRSELISELREAYLISSTSVLSGPASRKKKRISAQKVAYHLHSLATKTSLIDSADAAPTDNEDFTNDDEKLLLSRLERAQKLYTMAILAVNETEHVERIFGLYSNAPNNANIGSDEQISDNVVASPEMKAAARRIRYLLAATGREPCQNAYKNFGALKVTITVGGERIRLKHIATNTILSGVKIGFDQFSANDKLAMALLKREGKRAPCVRCQIFGQSFFTCRVVRNHSNPDFDFVANWKEFGGIDGLLVPFKDVLVDLAGVSIAQAANVQRTAQHGMDGDGGMGDDDDKDNTGANDVEPTVNMKDPSDDLEKAKETLKTAKMLQGQASKLDKQPPRLGKRFIETTFPVDPTDGRYIWCTICGLSGDVLCCDGCVNVVHPACVGLEDVPGGSWFCHECTPAESAASIGDKETSTQHVEPRDPLVLSDESLEEKLDALDEMVDSLNNVRFPNGKEPKRVKIHVGTQFYKTFPRMGRFQGTVVSLPEGEGTPYYHVTYDDGDFEDLEYEEIAQLVRESRGRGRPRKHPTVNGDSPQLSRGRPKTRDLRANLTQSPRHSRPNRTAARTTSPSGRKRAVSSTKGGRRSWSTAGRRGWTDDENDLFFDGITEFKADKLRDDRWVQIADTIPTKSYKQVFDQLYWFFHGRRERAYELYLERKEGISGKEADKRRRALIKGLSPPPSTGQASRGDRQKRSRAKSSTPPRASKKRRYQEEDTPVQLPRPPRPSRSERMAARKNSDSERKTSPSRRKRTISTSPSKTGRRTWSTAGQRGWTDDENDLFFSGITKFKATKERDDRWIQIAETIPSRSSKQVSDQLYWFFHGRRERAFELYLQRKEGVSGKEADARRRDLINGRHAEESESPPLPTSAPPSSRQSDRSRRRQRFQDDEVPGPPADKLRTTRSRRRTIA